MTNLIKKHSNDEHADSIANYLPGGRLFKAAKITGTNLRKLLKGLAGELLTVESFFKTIADEYDINGTTLFLDEWEEAVGIPDSCLLGNGTIEERRRDVLAKLASLGVQTVDDFENLATLFGISVVVSPGNYLGDVFPITFPYTFTSLEDRFKIIVEYTVTEANRFPLTFPITFGDANIIFLECLFNKLKPANCIVEFNQV